MVPLIQYDVLGILADTHDIGENTIRHLVTEFDRRGVKAIIHAGDIEPQHLNRQLFGNRPLICALIKPQVDNPGFKDPPEDWVFTYPHNRVVNFGGNIIYVGHQRSFELLGGSWQKFEENCQLIRRDNDGLRWMFAGHTHHQILVRGSLTTFVNPGAVQDSLNDSYEFAVVNTATGEVVFSRILPTQDQRRPISIGVISDSFDVSKRDPGFWKKLVEEFHRRDVSRIIHCGNIAIDDIGLEILKCFEVFYYLRADQKNIIDPPENWHLINSQNPTVDIEGYRFYVHLELGADFLEQSEMAMHRFCLKLRVTNPDTNFVLCGLTANALYEEQPEMSTINPGSAVCQRSFVVICLPRSEITFGHVPIDPLPPLENGE